MKIIVLGDTHGRSFWKLIIELEKPDRVVFIGDYFDTHEDISPAEQIHNFKEIIQYKEENPSIEFIMLIGNHDHHYFNNVGESGTSGYQRLHKIDIGEVLEANREHLQMCYTFENYLFSHAGISSTWLDNSSYIGELNDLKFIETFINDLWINDPKDGFIFNGVDSGGDDLYQTPIWIRPHSLYHSNKDSALSKSCVQIVGHTTMGKLTINPLMPYIFIDVLGVSGEYLVINDDKLTIGKI